MSKPVSIQIIIPQPCSQSWDEMNPNGQGRHCAHCRKTVIDFTAWTDTALYNFFSKDQGHVCGRFLTSQVDRTIAIPYQPQSRLYRMTIALGLTLIFTQAPHLLAQSKSPKIEQNALLQPAKPSADQFGELKGQVLDDKKEPLINAIIQVSQNGILKGGNVTNYDGNYSIKPLEPGSYQVIALYSGYDSAIATINIIRNEAITNNFQLTIKSGLSGMPTTMGYRVPLINRNSEPEKPTKPVKKKKH